jgi:hypothetical protein
MACDTEHRALEATRDDAQPEQKSQPICYGNCFAARGLGSASSNRHFMTAA